MFCIVDYDECASNPCLNGGSCGNHFNQFTCDCNDRFEGIICEKGKYILGECTHIMFQSETYVILSFYWNSCFSLSRFLCNALPLLIVASILS